MTTTIRVFHNSTVTLQGDPGIRFRDGHLVFAAWWARSGNSTNRGKAVWVGAWFWNNSQVSEGIMGFNKTDLLLRAPRADDVWDNVRP
jgi:hypothetical protein